MVAEALGEAETAGWIGLAPLTLYVQTDKILISIFLGVSYFCVVRLAAHVSNGLKSRIRPVVGRI